MYLRLICSAILSRPTVAIQLALFFCFRNCCDVILQHCSSPSSKPRSYTNPGAPQLKTLSAVTLPINLSPYFCLLVKSGGHTGHTLHSEEDADHQALTPIVEEILWQSIVSIAGMTVNLTQRAMLAGTRHQKHRHDAAVRILHGWSPAQPMSGLSRNSTYSSPTRARSRYSHLPEQSEDACCGVGFAPRSATMLAEQLASQAALTCCGHCNADTVFDAEVVHCSQCHSVFHHRCAQDNNESPSMCDENWSCNSCLSENAADDAAAPPDMQRSTSRAAGWLPHPRGPRCPGSLLTQPQAEHLLAIFKIGPVGRSGQLISSSAEATTALETRSQRCCYQV